MTSGVDPSGYFAVANEVSTSSRGVAAPIFDVGAELVVEPLQRVDAHRLVIERPDPRAGTVGAQHRTELLVVFLGDTE